MNTWLKPDSSGIVKQVSFSEIAPDESWIQDNDYPIFGKTGYKYNVTTQQWIPDTQEEINAAAAMAARTQRDNLLAASDWTDTVSAQTRLGPLYATWQTYRQALRDITQQSGFPTQIIWPTPPSSS